MKQTTYTDKRFGGLTFNPVIDEEMLSAYPKLNEIVDEPWLEDPAIDQLLRYTVLMYDPASPLIREESDLNHRRTIAIEVAGIDNVELVEQLESHTHSFAPELIYNYLKRFAKSKEFAILMALEYKFWEAIKIILQPVNGKGSKEELESITKKSVVTDEVEKDIKRIEIHRKEFFGDDILEVEIKKRVTPESIAGIK